MTRTREKIETYFAKSRRGESEISLVLVGRDWMSASFYFGRDSVDTVILPEQRAELVDLFAEGAEQ